MARLTEGTLPTPANTRLKRYRVALENAGGRRVIVDLEKPAADALAVLEETTGKSKKALISAALISYAQVPPKAPFPK